MILFKLLILLILYVHSLHAAKRRHGKEKYHKTGKRDFVGEPKIKIIGRSCAGEWCDPGHEPYNNIVAAFTGYNIIKGNPYSSGVGQDPGFETAYIFSAIGADSDRRYSLHSGVTVRQVRKCQLKKNSRIINNMQSYRRSLVETEGSSTSFESNPPIAVKADIKGIVNASTVIPPLVEYFSSESKVSKNNKNFLDRKEGILTINDAKCGEYVVKISYFNAPPFSETLRRRIVKLSAITTLESTVEKQKLLNSFMDEFGTHLLRQVTMGSRIAIQRKYTTNEWEQKGASAIDRCNQQRIGVNFVFSASTTTQKCSNFQNTRLDEADSSNQRETIVSFGSKPTMDLETWAEQDFDAPLPIGMTLRPITDIFSDSFNRSPNDKELTDGDGRRINYQAIHETIMPLYEKYVTETPVIGTVCGINDKCDSITQICEPGPADPTPTVLCKYNLQKDATINSYILEKVIKSTDMMGVEARFNHIMETLLPIPSQSMNDAINIFVIHYKRTNCKCKIVQGGAIVEGVSKSKAYETFLGWELKQFQDTNFHSRMQGALHDVEGDDLDHFVQETKERLIDLSPNFGFVLACAENLDDTVTEPIKVYGDHWRRSGFTHSGLGWRKVYGLYVGLKQARQRRNRRRNG